MSIVAKMRIHNINQTDYAEELSATAVYDDNPESPNHSWSMHTPNGSLSLTISNPGARGHFKLGQEVYVTVSEVLPS